MRLFPAGDTIYPMNRLLCALPLLASALSPAQTNSPLLLQKPTFSRTQIVFVYAGDLWSVPRKEARPSGSPPARASKTNPKFSPDGSQIAFTAEYDGNVDVFTIPAEGGVPKRVTFHPSPDIVLGWTPDGSRILFTSSAHQLFALPRTVHGCPGCRRDSREARRCPWVLKAPIRRTANTWPTCLSAAHSLPGNDIAAAKPRRSGSRRWPVATPKKSRATARTITTRCGSGDKIYFLSDRNGPVSLFSYDPRSKQVKQVLENQGLDLKSASAGSGRDRLRTVRRAAISTI